MHPFLQQFFEKNKEQFRSSNEEFVKREAIHLCEDRVWCSFLSVLSLSSVLTKDVHLHYPDFGPKKYRLLWNSIISPRQSYDDCKSKSFSLDFKIIDIHLLFCKLSQTSDK